MIFTILPLSFVEFFGDHVFVLNWLNMVLAKKDVGPRVFVFVSHDRVKALPRSELRDVANDANTLAFLDLFVDVKGHCNLLVNGLVKLYGFFRLIIMILKWCHYFLLL